LYHAQGETISRKLKRLDAATAPVGQHADPQVGFLQAVRTAVTLPIPLGKESPSFGRKAKRIAEPIVIF
jgi:hypothetical protein